MTETAAFVSRSKSFGLEAQCIFDETHDHYLLVYYGWDKGQRYYITALHVRIKDGKIHVEEENTEEGIATELIRAGVPENQIVMGFHPPSLRHLTEFAVA